MNIARFRGGDRAACDKLNELVDAVNRLQTVTGDGIITTAHSPDGTVVGISIERLTPRLPKFGMRLARAIAPDVRTESGLHAPAWINDGVLPYVYGWPTNFADGADAPPALSSSTASQFVKVYLPGSTGQDPNVRGGQVFTYYTTEERNWIGPGGWYDDPLYTLKMYIEPSSTPTIRPGWHLMDDEDTTLRLPNTDVDTLGAIFDVNQKIGPPAITGSVNLQSRLPYGAGNNPDVTYTLPPWPAVTVELELLTDESTGGADPSADLGLFSTHYVGRIN